MSEKGRVSQRVVATHLITGVSVGFIIALTAYALLLVTLNGMGLAEGQLSGHELLAHQAITIGVPGLMGGAVGSYLIWHHENQLTGVRLVDVYGGNNGE